jgi:lipopolysaccharide transport system ATP-binding protein
MSDTIIRVENLGKKYIIGHQQQKERYTALRDVVANGAKGLINRFNPKSKIENPNLEEFWALKDVSFEVKRGDRIGIIGRNGAGKSTLLKILSRITEPTAGRIQIKGRVASLLEVGTGFHPELTGRENIYLNGAILGMSKREIHRKFDEIVAFAEVEKFLDTPVKRYSSGMYVRLAFAVAAHLEPEILIVDEVLAVGDAQFQKKCLGKMEDVATNEGRTVLFVSHNMAVVRSLCNVGVLLEKGQVSVIDSGIQVTSEYLKKTSTNACSSITNLPKPKNAPLWLESAVLYCSGKVNDRLHIGENLAIELKYCAESPIKDPKIGLVIYSDQGEPLINANNHYQPNKQSLENAVLNGIIFCDLGKLPLMEGRYSISLWFGDSVHNYQHVEYALNFEVIAQDVWGTAKLPPKVSPLWWNTEFCFI